MTRITFTKSASTLLRKCDALLIVAPARCFADGGFLDCLPEDLMRLALDLASDTKPGDGGAAAGTLTGSKPRKLAIGVLPDSVSRYNSPARAEAIRAVVAQSQTGTKGNASILLVLDEAEHYVAAANAIGRCLPMFCARSGKTPAATLSIMAMTADEKPLAANAVVQETLTSTREAARLVDSPPTDMNPRALQAAAYKLVRDLPRVTKATIVGEALITKKLGGLHAVGRTAREKPRLIVLTYTPAKRSKKHVALVGKGITYDTGGLSLKSTPGMCGMKADMGGAAAVLGAFRTLAASGAPHKVSALLCAAENAIGPAAFKNDDVLKFHSGKTVEINNTDAEGRLVLGDGVSYAARVLKADVVLDAATLTGAQLIATGKLHAAVISNDAELEELMVEAGRTTGDLVHPLPFAPEFYKKEFSSEVADMKNSVADRMNAQSSCAGQFIYWHMEDTGARWAHVDLAGPAFPGKRATGFGAALLAEAVRRLR
ncbi:MAG: leucyl aminopeptidase family protein [bacterium]|nr:leucyl aminopeptidase family protein [bacterium]